MSLRQRQATNVPQPRLRFDVSALTLCGLQIVFTTTITITRDQRRHRRRDQPWRYGTLSADVDLQRTVVAVAGRRLPHSAAYIYIFIIIFIYK